ncbi:MAG: hypothetical protein IJU98_12020 [Synergistaceae bacterium]|nr:hypothetical protein [Synergistaceae bacterium]
MNSVPLSFALYEASQTRSRRKNYWKTRGEKLHDRLALEQEIYAARRYEWAVEQEIQAERRQQQQINERAALSEIGVEPGTIGLISSVLPVLRGTDVFLNR